MNGTDLNDITPCCNYKIDYAGGDRGRYFGMASIMLCNATIAGMFLICERQKIRGL
jgi:hypothetical protein